MLRGLLLSSIVLMACAPQLPSPADRSARPTSLKAEDAVLPYSYELEEAQRYAVPFMVRFEKGDRKLVFIAADHGCDPKTFRLIDDVLATHPVRMVVFEGYPSARGVNPTDYSRQFEPWAASGFCAGGGEAAYAAFHAMARGASFVGGEPDERFVVRVALEQGFTSKDLLGFYFVRQIPQLRREGALTAKGLDASFRMVMAAVGQLADLEDASVQLSLDQFREWYRTKQGKAFDPAAMDGEEAAPLASGQYFTQRISAVVGLVRDRFIVQRIASVLASEKDVVVVYGRSHFPTQRPALELLMGKPVEQRPGK